ncbi:MAG: queuosine 5'-phosphate N-glycosylase/hydrolase [Minisyncoccia bacterium]
MDENINVLTTTKYVIDNAQFVKLNLSRLDIISKIVENRLQQGLQSAEESFGVSKNLTFDTQLVFIEDVVNFCFWSKKNEPRWEIEFHGKNIGGYYGLVNALVRAIENNIPILDANYLMNLNQQKISDIFKSSNGIEIPLLNKRLDNLIEAGRVLQQKFGGLFLNVIQEANFDALKLVQLIFDNFSSFQDTAEYKGKKIYFLKRAQIVANDIVYLQQKYNFNLTNIDKLTAFADYKIPQILRHFGLLVYSDDLAYKVDNYIEIPAGSEYEIEIRAASIWGVEFIKQYLKNKYLSTQIDNAIWLISQDQNGLEPFHRTLTYFY